MFAAELRGQPLNWSGDNLVFDDNFNDEFDQELDRENRLHYQSKYQALKNEELSKFCYPCGPVGTSSTQDNQD